MTQPVLETNYTRALRLLGLRPASRALSSPLTVQSVQVIADVGDVSIPHSNPVFGWNQSQVAPGVGNMAMITMQATSRLLRVRQIFAFTSASMRIYVVDADPMTTVIATLAAAAGSSLGPVEATRTAIVRSGHSVGFGGPNFAYLPAALQFDLRPPLLIAPGRFFVLQEATANQTLTASAIYEEIPEQDAVSNVGFPSIAES